MYIYVIKSCILKNYCLFFVDFYNIDIWFWIFLIFCVVMYYVCIMYKFDIDDIFEVLVVSWLKSIYIVKWL